MKKPSPAHVDAARRLLAHEGGNGGSAEADAAAAARVYEKLHLHLTPLVGLAAVQVLFARSAKLTRGEFPRLGDSAFVESSTKLQECLRAQEPAVIEEAAAALFGAFLDLITTFIGEALMTEVLRRAWPAVEESAAKESAAKESKT
jgi:hypothetical protein